MLLDLEWPLRCYFQATRLRILKNTCRSTQWQCRVSYREVERLDPCSMLIRFLTLQGGGRSKSRYCQSFVGSLHYYRGQRMQCGEWPLKLTALLNFPTRALRQWRLEDKPLAKTFCRYSSTNPVVSCSVTFASLRCAKLRRNEFLPQNAANPSIEGHSSVACGDKQ